VAKPFNQNFITTQFISAVERAEKVQKGCAISVINPMKGGISAQPRQLSCFRWKFQESLMKMRMGRRARRR